MYEEPSQMDYLNIWRIFRRQSPVIKREAHYRWRDDLITLKPPTDMSDMDESFLRLALSIPDGYLPVCL